MPWMDSQPPLGEGWGGQGGGHLSSVARLQGPLCLSETLRGIQVSGPTQLQNFQKMTVTLNFLGR